MTDIADRIAAKARTFNVAPAILHCVYERGITDTGDVESSIARVNAFVLNGTKSRDADLTTYTATTININTARAELGLPPLAFAEESKAERAALAKKQLRDKHGKFIEMGGLVKWKSNLSGKWLSGEITAVEPSASGDGTGYATVKTKSLHNDKDISVKVAGNQLEVIEAKATLDPPGRAPTTPKTTRADWKEVSGAPSWHETSDGFSIQEKSDGSFNVKVPSDRAYKNYHGMPVEQRHSEESVNTFIDGYRDHVSNGAPRPLPELDTSKSIDVNGTKITAGDQITANGNKYTVTSVHSGATDSTPASIIGQSSDGQRVTISTQYAQITKDDTAPKLSNAYKTDGTPFDAAATPSTAVPDSAPTPTPVPAGVRTGEVQSKDLKAVPPTYEADTGKQFMLDKNGDKIYLGTRITLNNGKTGIVTSHALNGYVVNIKADDGKTYGGKVATATVVNSSTDTTPTPRAPTPVVPTPTPAPMVPRAAPPSTPTAPRAGTTDATGKPIAVGSQVTDAFGETGTVVGFTSSGAAVQVRMHKDGKVINRQSSKLKVSASPQGSTIAPRTPATPVSAKRDTSVPKPVSADDLNNTVSRIFADDFHSNKSVPQAVKDRIQGTYAYLDTKYHISVGRIGSISIDNAEALSRGDVMAYYRYAPGDPIGGELNFSEKHFSNETELDKRYKGMQRSSWFVASKADGVAGVATHEFGHHLDNQLAAKGVQDDLRAKIAEYLSPARGETRSRHENKRIIEQNKSKIAKELGIYASANDMELVAEAFVKYRYNDNPGDLAMIIGTFIDTYLGTKQPSTSTTDPVPVGDQSQ